MLRTQYANINQSSHDPMLNPNSNPSRIKMLIIIFLSFVIAMWVLFNIEGMIKDYNDQIILDQLGVSKITRLQIQQAILQYYNKGISQNIIVNEKKGQQSMQNDVKEQAKGNSNSFCIILHHNNSNQDWLGSTLSLLSQNYPYYKIISINNPKFASFMDEYSKKYTISNQKYQIYSIPGVQHIPFQQLINIGINYCHNVANTQYDIPPATHIDTYVLIMDDQWVFINNQVLSMVNLHIQQLFIRQTNNMSNNTKVDFIYGPTLYHDHKNDKIKLGKSYPYPQQIIKSKQYRKYNFVIDGPIIVKYDVLMKLRQQNWRNSQNRYLNKCLKPAIYIQMLQKSKQISYLPTPLWIAQTQSPYILHDDPQLKLQMDHIRSINPI